MLVVETIARICWEHLGKGVAIEKISSGFEGFPEHGLQGIAERRDIVWLRARGSADAEAGSVG